MKNNPSFLCVRGLKSLYSCGILHGGGGGLNGYLALKKHLLKKTLKNDASARKLAFTYNNLIKKLQGVFRNADFSFYLRL